MAAAKLARKQQRARPAQKKASAKAPQTVASGASVKSFLASLDEPARADSRKLDAWMRAATGSTGVMYGKSIVGYGTATIRYADGREVPWMKLGFSPRKQALTLYGVLSAAPASLLGKLGELGKHSTGKGCLYVKRLSDVNEAALRAILELAAK